jgi:hypothetical protein
MAKANSAPRVKDPAITVDQRRVARGGKMPTNKQAWAQALIRKAIKALRREGSSARRSDHWADYRSLLEMDEGQGHAGQRNPTAAVFRATSARHFG